MHAAAGSFLFLSLNFLLSCRVTETQMPCSEDYCICLMPVGTFCTSPVQDLSGYGSRLPEIIPGSFAQAGFVRNLSLANNDPLRLLNGSFQGLTNAEFIDLSSNQIADLPDGVFTPVVSLISLDLRRNSLSTLNPEAFRGLTNLRTLNIQSNRLGVFPAADLLPLLPSLATIHLSGNDYDCEDARTVELYETLTRSSLNVADRIFVRCSNGTSVLNLHFEIPATPVPTTATFSTQTLTTSMSALTSVGFIATSAVSSLPSPITPSTTVPRANTPVVISPTQTSAVIISSTTQSSASATLLLPFTTPTPSPTALPNSCPEETVLSNIGYMQWPESSPGSDVILSCPNGPPGGVALRVCLPSGMWSSSVEDHQCSEGSETEQLLADISTKGVTESNSEELSAGLASIPAGSALSLQELGTLTEIAAELVVVGSTDILVLNNTLKALDNVLESSSSAFAQEEGNVLSRKIRAVIDSILLDALSINQTQLVFSFSHLAVGGAYLPVTNNTHLLASIRILTNGSVAIEVGGEGDGGDITVEVEGNSTVQVTVYEGPELFRECSTSNYTRTTTNESVIMGQVVTPIVSVVITEDTAADDDDEVILTYSRVPHGATDSGDEYVCARWNSSISSCGGGGGGGGGGWTTKDCSLVTTPSGTYQCRCLHQGTFTLLDIRPEAATKVPPLENIPLISRVIFYILVTASIPLFLTIIITICVTKELRSLPLMQSLANQSLAQGLTFFLLALSFERNEVVGVCFVLGAAMQYLYLVTLSWQLANPVLMCIKIFKRMFYEKAWLVLVFMSICWVWPALPVAVYGGLRYDVITEAGTSTFICWVESGHFPNTIIYLTAATVLGVIVTAMTCFLLLCCSDYTIETSTYLRLLTVFPNHLLFVGVILTQYFTAAASELNVNPDYILLGVGSLALLCGCSFFLTNTLLNSKLRNPMFCREDPLTKKKSAGYSTDYACRRTPEESGGEDSNNSSQSATPQPFARRKHRSKNTPSSSNAAHLNMNHMGYVTDYLTTSPSQKQQQQQQQPGSRTNPLPLSLFGQVQPGPGRVRRSGVDMCAPNPAYRLDLSSDV